MSDNPLLRDLTPHLTQRGRFRPEPGARIAITLPGEVVAGIVIKVVTADTLIVQLGPVFFQKPPQADIEQAPRPTVIQPSPTQSSPTASLPQADTDHRSSAAPDAVETRIVKGKDGTLKRESKPRRGRGKPPQPHQA